MFNVAYLVIILLYKLGALVWSGPPQVLHVSPACKPVSTHFRTPY
jgi:hypothetical protein